MDFFSSVVNVSFVGAIIVIIEVIKQVLKNRGKEVSGDTWKIVVLIIGVPMAVIMSFIEGWTGESIMQIIFNFILKCFLYSASATLIYQTGKLSIETLFANTRKPENGKGPKNNMNSRGE
ncbi:MAG: hypothetical protein JXB88_25530 [Spirochaetales bacterium]|nr:hypothetical protein [Spirochaetales bacterium]